MEQLQGTLTPLVHAHAGRTQNNAPDKPVIIALCLQETNIGRTIKSTV